MTVVKKRRRRKKNILAYILLIIFFILIVALVVFLLNFNIHFIGKKSIHDDALTYKTKSCLVFYPDNKNARDRASDICSRANENAIFDYALIPYGDYYLVSYKDGTKYYVDKSYNDLTIGSIDSEDGKKIISDYLRYSMKKDEIDLAYTYDFLNETYYENLDLSNVTYKIDGENLIVYFDKYSYDVSIPLKYMQEILGINLGYNNEVYVRPHYISKNRKKICFTFDDGPDLSFTTSGQIVDTLYKYDSSATFFVLGNRLGEKQINYIKGAVQKGMEYGSHTQDHKNLTKLSQTEANEQIYIPYHDLYDGQYGFGYKMKVFRPPYGAFNDTVASAANGLIAVLWNVDSLDWSYRTKYDGDKAVDIICDKVINDVNEDDVVLFHDIYKTSADAACRLIVHYIKEGYQILNASELMEALDMEDVSRFYGK